MYESEVTLMQLIMRFTAQHYIILKKKGRKIKILMGWYRNMNNQADDVKQIEKQFIYLFIIFLQANNLVTI